jgi:hypothetical protein
MGGICLASPRHQPQSHGEGDSPAFFSDGGRGRLPHTTSRAIGEYEAFASRRSRSRGKGDERAEAIEPQSYFPDAPVDQTDARDA